MGAYQATHSRFLTRQINYVDLVVIHTGHVARLPWDNFEYRHRGGLLLGLSEAQVVLRSDVKIVRCSRRGRADGGMAMICLGTTDALTLNEETGRHVP